MTPSRTTSARRLLIVAAIAAGGALAATGIAHAYAGAQYRSEATVSPAQAKKIALKAQPGTIEATELEKEQGGSGLRYSFDVKSGQTTHEVGVDAKTGKVLEDSVEGPDSD